MLIDLKQKRATRKLTPIEKRMLASVQRHLRDDRVSVKWLLRNKTWDLDGKAFRQLFAALGREDVYAYGFGIGSHWVHGSWFDLKTYHLRKEGRRYKAKLDYSVPDPRNICPVATLSLTAALRYMAWAKVDPDRQVSATVSRLLTVNHVLDAAHERSLRKSQTLGTSRIEL